MKLIRWLYSIFASIVFGILFFIFFLLLLIPITFPKQHHLTGIFNRWWARLFFGLIGIPWIVDYRAKLNSSKQYIFCPNHFSYLDIPAMGLNRHNTVFVGKNDMENIPLFGFMYRKLHITVDRARLKSKFNAYRESFRAIDNGKSLVIYPEGGIITIKDPVMAPFKDGAFRIAIDKQIPIVPVTIPYNWIILPPDQFLLRWGKMKLIFHEPIETSGLTTKDTDALRRKVFTIINTELKKQLDEYYARNIG